MKFNKTKDINKSSKSDLDSHPDQESKLKIAIDTAITTKQSITYNCKCKGCNKNYTDFGVTSICDRCLTRASKEVKDELRQSN